MSNAQKIIELMKLFGRSVRIFERKRVLGLFSVTLSRGWLWIDDAGDHWSVTFANGETVHQPFWGPALGADFRKNDGERKIGPLDLTGAWKTAISMWPIRKEEEAVRVFSLVASRVDLAYRYHCTGLACTR